VKKDTLLLAVATVVVVSHPVMGGKSSMSWVNMIYYCLIACLGEQGLISWGHTVRSESAPHFVKHALWRQWREAPICGQVHRHVDLGQIGHSPLNKLSGIYYCQFKGYICVWLPQLASKLPRHSYQCMDHIVVFLVACNSILGTKWQQ